MRGKETRIDAPEIQSDRAGRDEHAERSGFAAGIVEHFNAAADVERAVAESRNDDRKQRIRAKKPRRGNKQTPDRSKRQVPVQPVGKESERQLHQKRAGVVEHHAEPGGVAAVHAEKQRGAAEIHRCMRGGKDGEFVDSAGTHRIPPCRTSVPATVRGGRLLLFITP